MTTRACAALPVLLLGLFLGTATAQELPQDHPKTVVARQVFADLVRAFGDGRTAPRLELLSRGAAGRLQVAWFLPRQHLLVLEERAYDLCATLGPDSLNSLAVLLGHELAHYYQDHGWVGDFGNGFADLEVGQTLEQLRRSEEMILDLETQADFFGGFYGYVAGYNTLEIAPQLLAELYDEYGLSTELRGYPALPDRQEIARRQAVRLRDLVPVFEAGQRLLLVHQYAAAARCFDFLGHEFPSREILNNAGVARALEALQFFPPEELRQAYPFELDATTRLQQGSQASRSGSAAAARQQREQLLQEAAARFEQACARDPAYPPARINLACVAALQGEYLQALAHAHQAVELAGRIGEPASLADARIARGIARLRADPADPAGARQDFAQARLGNPLLAQLNLDALEPGVGPALAVPGDEGEKLSVSEPVFAPGTPPYEAIVEARDAFAELPGGGSGQAPMRIYAKRTQEACGLIVDTGHSTIAFLETAAPSNRRTGQGIGVGSPLAAVEQAYGRPARAVAGRQGTYTVYEKNRLIFLAAPGGRVARWLQYDIDTLLYEAPAASAPSQEPVEPRVALVIGNGGYASGPLRNAVNDARAMAQALGECGFQVSQTFDADRRNMLQAIREFGNALRQGGVGLFYYAGHGVQVEGANYLVPVDADLQQADDAPEECVQVATVLKHLESANNRVNIVILDACRNNPFPSQYRSSAQGLATMDPPRGSILVYATGPGAVAVDQGEGGNGLFTSRLLQYMRLPGLEFNDLFGRIGEEVSAASSDRQRPWKSSDFYGKFYFRPPADQPSAAGSSSPPAMGFTVAGRYLAPPANQPSAPRPPPTAATGFLPSPQVVPAVQGGEMVPVADFGFYIDQCEVTNAEFADFLNAEGNQIEGGELWLDAADPDARVEYRDGRYAPRSGYADHPVVAVTWYGANRYCEWARKRLPTQEEWQQAALGRDRRRYPWGDELPDTGGVYRANYYQEGTAADGYERTAPVGSFAAGASPYGALDLVGNVWEWCANAKGELRAAQGGSWENDASYLGATTPLDPSYAMGNLGFRCAWSP